MMDFHFESLNESNYSPTFICGNQEIDNWFHNKALESDDLSCSRTYLLLGRYTSKEEESILGFYSLRAGAQTLSNVEGAKQVSAFSGLQKIPLIEITYLARHLGGRGRRLGDMLLFDALIRIHTLASSVGIAGVYLATSEQGKPLYKRWRFEPFGDYNRYLPITEINIFMAD